ncbi:NAD(P)-binding domain-containing protein [Paraburkholderia heleia]|uniref:hypothetical protein n=1 Tax=Paraburkholderia heleia TaxID=634127 RepID=UPI000A05DAF1|nr:hypothetical protein [Paraburkholderia heleia]
MSRQLVEALECDAFDAGSLAESWRQQPGQPAYCTDATRAELRSLLARAAIKLWASGSLSHTVTTASGYRNATIFAL